MSIAWRTKTAILFGHYVDLIILLIEVYNKNKSGNIFIHPFYYAIRIRIYSVIKSLMPTLNTFWIYYCEINRLLVLNQITQSIYCESGLYSEFSMVILWRKYTISRWLKSDWSHHAWIETYLWMPNFLHRLVVFQEICLGTQISHFHLHYRCHQQIIIIKLCIWQLFTKKTPRVSIMVSPRRMGLSRSLTQTSQNKLYY